MPKNTEFRRIGGVRQMVVSDLDDLRAVLSLDEANWAINCIDIDLLRTDRKFLNLLDSDHDGNIRPDEVKKEIAWMLDVLRDGDGFEKSSDCLKLSAIDDSNPAGAKLLAAAKFILKNLGRSEENCISRSMIEDRDAFLACKVRNGDGVVTEAMLDERGAKLIGLVKKYVGATADRSGADGVDSALLDKFVTLVRAYIPWADASGSPEVRAFGDDTERVYSEYMAIEKDFDEFFNACRLLAFCPGTGSARLAGGDAVDLMNPASVDAFFASAPIANPNTEMVLDFGTLERNGNVNPLKAARARAFAEDPAVAGAIGGEFAEHGVLSCSAWTAFKKQMSSCRKHETEKPECLFEGEDIAMLREMSSDSVVAELRDAIEADRSVAECIQTCVDLSKLVLYQSYMREFLNHYVSISRIFESTTPSMLQIGRLVMDGRCFTLVTKVKNIAEHKRIASESNICSLYLEVQLAKEKMNIVAGVTSGNVKNLFLGKYGIFIDPDGHLWQAKVVDMIIQPASATEAFILPFVKFGQFVSKQVDKFFSTKSQDGLGKLEKGLPVVNAEVKPASSPVSGSMLLMGGGIGIAALGSSVAFIIKSMAGVMFVHVLLFVLAIVVIFGGPVVLNSLVKLHRRSLSKFLEAGGCAVNRSLRITGDMGRMFTYIPVLETIPGIDYGERNAMHVRAVRRGVNIGLIAVGAIAILVLAWFGLCWIAGWSPIPSFMRGKDAAVSEKVTPSPVETENAPVVVDGQGAKSK
ncbi:MAG: hypothetical protein MJ025_03460 [Victivallaceae bacterium]|nr:hypothetical protein [Victivallaceae bacterium]